ncbi:TIGR03088 family PEP-CTERM/XrtA system glycosyltransferase [Bowmanella yangjiangensis]|uniref:TIGR03088 family PEP-CTERM/XrtA system glycosyltransferase n=1 Tax=Bowmanella yangjiangensis TaxID=2811230 RepID=A0ABS3CTB5_9ALTE|nr:TIGR03088 family PEP-CTERM/XrtA system glycosyltransferase [Bowmanella yangjiangensis]
MTEPLHIAHVLYRFDTGGLENGMVNLINQLGEQSFQHSIITLSGWSDTFRSRLQVSNVEFYDLEKQPGQDFGMFGRLAKLLRNLKPDVLHTRNLGSLECQVVGWWCGVPYRIHGEHGWDINDLNGSNKKYQWLRRIVNPFVHQFIGLSRESCQYLTEKVGVSPRKVSHICNGVELSRFQAKQASLTMPDGWNDENVVVFGTIGRLAAVKNQALLIRCFAAVQHLLSDTNIETRLMLVGDGDCKAQLQALSVELDVAQSVWFAGNQSQVGPYLQHMDVFVLPSLAEGISNTLLEAMACGLPVIATAVGGNGDLLPLEVHRTNLIPVDNESLVSQRMAEYARDAELRQRDGKYFFAHCNSEFSLSGMVERYRALYQAKSRGTDECVE